MKESSDKRRIEIAGENECRREKESKNVEKSKKESKINMPTGEEANSTSKSNNTIFQVNGRVHIVMLFHCVWCFFPFCCYCWAINEHWVRDKLQLFVYKMSKRKQISAVSLVSIYYFYFLLPCLWQNVEDYFSLPSFTGVCGLSFKIVTTLSFRLHFLYGSVRASISRRHLTYCGPNKLKLELCLFSFAFGMCNSIAVQIQCLCFVCRTNPIDLLIIIIITVCMCSEWFDIKLNSEYLHAWCVVMS